MIFKLNKEDKNRILKELNHILDCLVDFENGVYSDCSLEHRSMIFNLEEARINAENGKYFSIEKAIDIFDKVVDTSEIFGLFVAMNKVDGMIELAFHNLRTDYCVYKRFFEDDLKLIEFCINIKRHRDLCEEFTNYILDDEKFTCGYFIKIDGYDVNRIMEEFDKNIVEAYICMMLLREDIIKAKTLMR